MSKLKICRICLRTDGKGFKLESFHLRYYYEEVTIQKITKNDSLPQWFCFECAAMLHKYHDFKEKCFKGQKLLSEILLQGQITYEAVYKIDHVTKQLQSRLRTIEETKQDLITNADNTEDNVTDNEQNTKTDIKTDIDINTENYFGTKVDVSEDEIKSENVDMYEVIVPENVENVQNIRDWKQNNLVNSADTIVEGYSKKTKRRFKDVDIKFLNEANWKQIIMNEEEAIKEFRMKATKPKYLDAAFRCGHCFKGFSKKEMLNRHIHSRHSEEAGSHECWFCRMKFKMRCHLLRHLKQHYTKYECLRCNIIFNVDTSALLHEEYHSGITKKCMHCGQEFKHTTTFYSHVRSHRSEHVCVLCGASFVSAAGLHLHTARINHDKESSEDESDRETYCVRCDLRFGSRRAYREHLFHSNMHEELFKGGQDQNNSPSKKILGKREQSKITQELEQNKSSLDNKLDALVPGKRRKRIKRKRKIPSTCYQCGEHFETQSAYFKHHLRLHPGTSVYSPTDRHVCEQCGVSLAPGSVAIHKNMHSREVIYTCETCGRQFVSKVGLKRHLVTHTGEKPFGCPFCEKRFTQSNSLKLHYRTFHLKQPYPKRTPRKKKTEVQLRCTEQSYDSDSIAELCAEVVDGPEVAAELVIDGGRVIDGARVITERITEDNVHYMTLR